MVRAPLRLAGREGRGAIPIPFLVRLPFAIAVVVWGALTDRRWTVPVAGMLALPALWYGGLTMLLAVIALRDPSRNGGPADPTTPGTGRGPSLKRAGPAAGERAAVDSAAKRLWPVAPALRGKAGVWGARLLSWMVGRPRPIDHDPTAPRGSAAEGERPATPVAVATPPIAGPVAA
jgi:hypothetical protein